MHDSVSTALREGAEKPNAGASVPVIVHGDHPFSYRTRNSDASFTISRSLLFFTGFCPRKSGVQSSKG